MEEIKLPASVQPIAPVRVQESRQRLRKMGRAESQRQVNEQSLRQKSQLNRRQRRALAKELHQVNWQRRDKKLIAKVREGFTPEPQPLQIDVSKVSQ